GYRGLYINGGSPTIENSRIIGSKYAGVYDVSSTALLRGNEISRNGTYGIYSKSSTSTLENNLIQDNGSWGVYHYDNQAAPVLTGNTITGNKYSARLPISAVPNITDDPANNGNNLFVPNSVNGLWIIGSGLSRDLTLGSQSAVTGEVLNRYHIKHTLTVNTGISLNTVAGTTFKFAVSSGLTVNGTLNAVGSANAPIGFTSEKDDALGGDMNADGYATTAANGDWNGLTLNTDSDASVMSYGIVRFGGAGSNNNIYLNSSDAQLDHIEVSNSLNHGIRLNQSSASMSDLRVYGNSVDGISMESSGSPSITNSYIYANGDDGVEVTGNVNASVTGSELFGNLDYAIINASGNSNNVTATDNWWGAVDGPGGSGTGSGDEISDNVVISGQSGDDIR
ncbi:MAG: right-handed parallel beta-helix repeat-containing protein, partial [Gammaproteobacteria bacterium]|nr:right-handed parallel beta-helix repeat-containing protein [Gammaproteobacteria bacterium]